MGYHVLEAIDHCGVSLIRDGWSDWDQNWQRYGCINPEPSLGVVLNDTLVISILRENPVR